MAEPGPADDPAAAFAAAMVDAGPFERAPVLAVALSGGADSTCLLLLAAAWAQAHDGQVVALTVDHGLRAGSASEARAVGLACAARGLRHVVLPWTGPKPSRAIQERARETRHALLEAWCREAGVLHLLLGHHADDQAETIAMRAARSSGAHGLAGMAMVAERRHVRLIRPLLRARAPAIRAWLTARAEPWIEDPSNRDPRFLRTQLRQAGALAATPARDAAGRRELERMLARWLAAHATVHPEGWIEFGRAAFADLARDAADMAALALRAAAMTVSGAIHPPRRRMLDGAVGWLTGPEDAGQGRDFAGCRLLRGRETIAVLRDPSCVRGGGVPAGRSEAIWDRRFAVALPRAAPEGLDFVAAGDRTLAASAHRVALAALPAPRSLDGGPELSHVLCGRASAALVSVGSARLVFRPPRPLAGAAFAA